LAKPYITKKYESELAQRYADLQSIRRDLNKTIEMLNLLKPELEKPRDAQNTVLIESIWSSSLLRYCRCFASGKRFGLNETVFDGLPDDPVGLHTWIKGMRDKLIAHSVNPFEECKTIVILKEGNELKKIGVGFVDVSYVHPDLDGIANICKITIFLRDKVKALCAELELRLEKELESVESAEFEKLTDFNYVAPNPEQANRARKT
jgi:hypothetical protein